MHKSSNHKEKIDEYDSVNNFCASQEGENTSHKLWEDICNTYNQQKIIISGIKKKSLKSIILLLYRKLSKRYEQKSHRRGKIFGKQNYEK